MGKLIVQKFGGSSVANVERIQNVAKRVSSYKKNGHNLVVVVRYSSMNQETFESLSSSPGSYEAMQRGLNYLFKAGYPDKEHHLGIEAIISNENLKDIPDLWRWARKKNILPYMECMPYKGSAVARHDLYPDKQTTPSLFEKL